MKATLIAVIVIAALALGGFYALNQYIYAEKQANNGTDKLQSHASASHGFSFQYPKGYYLKENADGVVLIEDTQANRDYLEGRASGQSEGPTSITIDVYANPNNLAPDAWLQQSTNWIKNFPQTPVGRTVSGISGLEYRWDGLYAGKSVIVSYGNNAYVFSVTWITDKDMILEDFDTILGTVTFQ
ncbi:hypothetical protein C4552_03515 [Candidatus Parcubacteria bacterium]|nr:MAG: hypothetical protein C4552_03515 [Candidatus Parcubacteria bacterium]